MFDFGGIRSRIKASDARQQLSRATYEQTVLAAFQDVENALVAYANVVTENRVTLYKALGGGWEIETKITAGSGPRHGQAVLQNQNEIVGGIRLRDYPTRAED